MYSRNSLLSFLAFFFTMGVVSKGGGAAAAVQVPTEAEQKAEILASIGLELGEGEPYQDFLNRVVTEMGGLAEDGWAALTPAVQQWYNDASEQFNAQQPINPLPGDGPDGEVVATAKPAAVARRATTAAKPAAAAAPAVAAKPAAVAARPAAAAAKPAAVAAKPAAAAKAPVPAGAKPAKSSTRIVREIIVGNLQADSKAVLAESQKVLPDIKPSTVSTVYADTHAVLSVLVDQGVIASYAAQ